MDTINLSKVIISSFVGVTKMGHFLLNNMKGMTFYVGAEINLKLLE